MKISTFSIFKKDYRISSYSFRGNYSFLNLEIQRSQYIKMQKLFKGGNYSRAETIWRNTVLKFFAYNLKSDYWKLHSVLQLKCLYWLACKLWERKKCRLVLVREVQKGKKVGIKVSLRSWKNVTPAGGKVWTLTSLMTARIAPSIFALKILVLYLPACNVYFTILGNIFFVFLLLDFIGS